MSKGRFSAEQKFAIVLESLRGDRSVSELCREYGIAQSLFYKWRDKFFKEAREALTLSRRVKGEEQAEVRRLKQIIG